MSDLELIDRLCSVTSTLSDIVRRQAALIEEQFAVDDAIRREFGAAADEVEKELDDIEHQLRPADTKASMQRGGNTNGFTGHT